MATETAGNALRILDKETKGGSYFVSNYPPYSFWSANYLGEAHAALERPPVPGTPLGVYFHIPFCRKRCHFCYFKVYTDKDSSEIETYLDTAVRELEIYSQKPFIGGRKPKFIYFGGGTPSYISTRQLSRVVDGMRKSLPWDEAEEITFECEPGTLTEGKLQVLKEVGVTRLSLGIENFDEKILQENGRAHGAKEIDRAYQFVRSIGFPQVNVDLIAGMLGETEENWRECVRKTIVLDPDSVTIYQMEVPYNTTIFKEMKSHGETVAPVADWDTKRRWQDYAFREFEKAGYTITSAYTAVKDPAKSRFLYRSLLWTGADMVGLSASPSFSHVGGSSTQERARLGAIYQQGPVREASDLSCAHAYWRRAHDSRADHLQMEAGSGRLRLLPEQVWNRCSAPVRRSRFTSCGNRNFLAPGNDDLRLNRDGLLQVDKLLHEFFLPKHQ